MTRGALLSIAAVALSCLLLAPTAACAVPAGPSISWLRTPANFAHAMGGLNVNGKIYTYTNTLEAFKQNYDKGYRIFECDFFPTSDNGLACRHDWTPALFRELGERYPGHVPTTRQFLATKVFGKYTPMDINMVVGLMRSHPDMYVITDTKFSDSAHVRLEMRLIVKAMGKYKNTLAPRFIIQIYHEDMYNMVRSAYPWPNMILTTYHLPTSYSRNLAAVTFAKRYGIHVVTMDTYHYSSKLESKAHDMGIALAVNTINSPSRAGSLNSAGVRYLYTDSLASHDWWETSLTTSLMQPQIAPDAVPFNRYDD